MRENRRCVKCGSSPAIDPTVKLHRFPQPNQVNKSRCELWAKFCFPNDAWQSPQFQTKLFTEHTMLCDKHFKSTSLKQKTLNKNQLENYLVSETKVDKNTEQDILDDMEVVVIKTEPDDDIIIQEHCVETRSLQLRKQSPEKMSKVENFSKKKPPLKRSFEEWAEVDTQKKTNDMWNTEHPEKSQDNFNDAYDEWFARTSKYEQNDDCQLYGKLLTKKLRTYSVYERNLLMFKIDGLLIENPPGFDTSSHSFSINPTKSSNKASNARQRSKKKDSPTSSAMNLNSSSNNGKESSSSHTKKKKLKKESQAVQMSPPIKESYTKATQVTSTSMQSLSPVKITNDVPIQPAKDTCTLNQPTKVTNSDPKSPVKGKGSIQYQPVKVTSSIPNQSVRITSCILNSHVKVTSDIQNQPVKVTSDIQNQPVKVTSDIQNQSVKVSSSIPNKPVKVTSISDQQIAPQASSLPSHLPLHITIPETRFVPVTKSKFVASSTHPKGKIVIMKSRSGKFVPSSQPPILITVPSSSMHVPSVHFPRSTQNPLEQLSSIAVTHASQADQYQSSFDSEENGTADNINVVSHEIILSASTDSPS